MPELPEVEVIRRQLDSVLRGARITRVEVRLPRLVKYPSPSTYRRSLRERRILEVGRKGKYLLIRLEGGAVLVIHLGMTGSLRFSSPGEERPRHTHLVFHLEDGRELLYVDPRTFGETALLKEGDFRPLPGLHHLGPEPLDDGFTAGELERALRGRCRIKAALLDQSRVAGIGNIYADEALHRAGIHPLRRLHELTPQEIERLHRALREVLREAILRGGSSVNDYVDTRGKRGDFQLDHRVYRRAGEACPRCGGDIRRERVSGRSTYFCPCCQG
ncbi:MAG: bifunctional DNA-formamidopyrimidine glycosylase/DNA-(apurinic or apyrimidinic site) lyase [Actinomycetota bacterium]